MAKYLVILLEERSLAESGLRQAADFLDGLLEVKLERHELNQRLRLLHGALSWAIARPLKEVPSSRGLSQQRDRERGFG